MSKNNKKNKKNKKNLENDNKSFVGFFPCFEFYAHKKHPLSEFSNSNKSYVNHFKKFINAALYSKTVIELKNNATGKEIKPIRQGSYESIKVNKVLKYPYQIYRVDYGDNAFRLYFGFSSENRLIHILALDVKHTYFN